MAEGGRRLAELVGVLLEPLGPLALARGTRIALPVIVPVAQVVPRQPAEAAKKAYAVQRVITTKKARAKKVRTKKARSLMRAPKAMAAGNAIDRARKALAAARQALARAERALAQAHATAGFPTTADRTYRVLIDGTDQTMRVIAPRIEVRTINPKIQVPLIQMPRLHLAPVLETRKVNPKNRKARKSTKRKKPKKGKKNKKRAGRIV